jgi:hypothetical protein
MNCAAIQIQENVNIATIAADLCLPHDPIALGDCINRKRSLPMATRTLTLIHNSTKRISRLILLSSLITAAPFLVAGDRYAHGHNAHAQADQAKLVQIVRNATKQFLDVNNAESAGYGPFLGCVSGPDHGAMGVHYVNGSLVGDGEIDASHPEALIYERLNGQTRLVGVEFIVDAATWLANHSNTPPVLEGQVFLLVGSPNRYNLPSFFELHVWAWRHNPSGAFVDWNDHVSCAGQ